MKKLVKTLIAVTCILNMMFYNAETVDADVSGSISMSVSSSSVTVGDTITMTITASCPDGVVCQMNISYNSSYLTMTSYPSGDYYNGKLIIDTTSSSATKTFKFSTKAVGSTTISVSVINFLSYGAAVSGYSSSLSRTVKINQRSSGGGSGDSSSSRPSTPSLSSDASLSSISIEGQSLQPKFASDVTEYKVYLPKETAKLNIEAKTSSSKAKIGTISSEVHDGWNEIPIAVTAEDGTKKTYKILAYVEEKPDVFYSLGEEKLGVVKNLDNVEIYEGFEAKDLEARSTEEGKEDKNKLTVFNWSVYNLLYLENEDGKKNFYNYDRFTNSVTGVFHFVEIAGKRFVETPFTLSDFPEMAASMEETDFEMANGTSVKCLKYKDTMLRDLRVFYVADEAGQKHFYQYDMQEDTLQRYFPSPVSEPVIVEEKNNEYLDYAYMGLGGVSLLSLLVAMAAKRHYRKRNSV